MKPHDKLCVKDAMNLDEESTAVFCLTAGICHSINASKWISINVLLESILTITSAYVKQKKRQKVNNILCARISKHILINCLATLIWEIDFFHPILSNGRGSTAHFHKSTGQKYIALRQMRIEFRILVLLTPSVA